jgi:hypothetical protein
MPSTKSGSEFLVGCALGLVQLADRQEPPYAVALVMLEEGVLLDGKVPSTLLK